MALVGRWTLDGQAFDSSGQGNNGTVTGALYTNGKGSPGLWFDGTDDKVDCGTGSSINFVLANPFTACAWINNSLGSDDIIVGNSWGGPGWHLRVTSTNKIRFILVGSGGTTYRYVDSTSSLTAGWHHVAGTWDGSSVIKVYIDGVDVSNTQQTAGSLTSITSTNPVTIGLSEASAAFSGRIDDVRIYNTALDSTSIANIYAEPRSGVRVASSLNTGYLAFNSSVTANVPMLNTIGTYLMYDPWIKVSTGIGYTNSYVNFATAGYQDSVYYKDAFGIVHVIVGCKNGTANASMFTLPSGYRPGASLIVAAYVNGTQDWVKFMSDGTCINLVGAVTTGGIFCVAHFPGER